MCGIAWDCKELDNNASGFPPKSCPVKACRFASATANARSTCRAVERAPAFVVLLRRAKLSDNRQRVDVARCTQSTHPMRQTRWEDAREAAVVSPYALYGAAGRFPRQTS